MNNVQKNFRFTIVIVSALVLTIWAVLALSTEPKEPDQDVPALPSPWSLDEDDIQHYPPGPEFRLAREAAVIGQAAEEEASQQEADDEANSLMRTVTPQIVILEEEEEKLGILPP